MPFSDDNSTAAPSISNNGSPQQGLDPSLNSTTTPIPPVVDTVNVEGLALLDKLRKKGSKLAQVRLNKEELDKLARRIEEDAFGTRALQTSLVKKHKKYYKNWRSISEPKKEPYDGAPNIIVPLTASHVEKWVSRIHKALFGSTPIGNFTPIDDSITAKEAKEVTDWFDFELREVVNLPLTGEIIIRNLLIHGIDIVIPYYERTEKSLKEDYMYTLDEAALSTDQTIFDFLTGKIQEIFKDYEEIAVTKIEETTFTVVYNDDFGKPKESTVEFGIDGNTVLASVEIDKVIFDGVKLRLLKFNNIFAKDVACSIDELPFFIYKEWITVKQFLDMVAKEETIKLSPEDIQQIISQAGSRVSDLGDDDELERIKDEAAGTDSQDNNEVDDNDKLNRWLETYRWDGKWKVKNRVLDLTVWSFPGSKKVFRVLRADELTKDGCRAGVKFDFIPDKDRFYSIGLCEWLQHLQKEINAIHRQRLDAGLLANFPFFFYEPLAGFEQTQLKLRPGTGQPLKSIKGLVFPDLNFNPQWSFNEEALVNRYAQEQSGLGDPASGSFVSKRVSASEFLGVSQSIDLRTELIVQRLINNWRDLLYRIFGLYQRHMPDGRVYMVSGEKGEKEVKRLKRDLLNGKMDYRLSANLQQLNTQLNREVNVNMFTMLMNPLLIQMGIVQPDTVYEGLKKIFVSMQYDGVPIHLPEMPEMSPEPHIEHLMLARGQKIKSVINENQDKHLEAHSEMFNDPIAEKKIGIEGVRQLGIHIQETLKNKVLAQQLRQYQAQLAQEAQNNLNSQGLRPGLKGGTNTGSGAESATQEEGTPTGQSENL